MRIAQTAMSGALMLPVLLLAGTAQAQEGGYLEGQPTPWGLGFQPSATPIKDQIGSFHDILLWLITGISLFVLGLLLYVMVRFSARRNPTPTKTTHNTVVEVVWTVVPIVILVAIAIPSFKLLYAQDVIPDAEMTIKATGKQWSWTYELEHPENGIFQFDSYILSDEEAAAQGKPRLLGTDTPLVLPVDTDIRIIVTAADVLHSFAVPAFGTKIDAVPGRANETWVRIEKEGVYYGQCSELCGTGHAYMPIEIHAVSKAEYDAWLERTSEELADAGEDAPQGDTAATSLAQAASE
ncbi:MAG: cytochrome c oxidase subunit II [Rhodovibrionaceae bacterium]